MNQKLSLSSHILDTTKGVAAENVKVRLFKLIGGIWLESNFNGSTDKDGRVKEFPLVDQTTLGVYKLRFETAEYFQGIASLYPFIEVSKAVVEIQTCTLDIWKFTRVLFVN